MPQITHWIFIPCTSTPLPHIRFFLFSSSSSSEVKISFFENLSLYEVLIPLLFVVFMRYLQPKLPIPYTVVIMLLGTIYGLIAAKVYPPLLNYTAMVSLVASLKEYSKNASFYSYRPG